MSIVDVSKHRYLQVKENILNEKMSFRAVYGFKKHQKKELQYCKEFHYDSLNILTQMCNCYSYIVCSKHKADKKVHTM